MTNKDVDQERLQLDRERFEWEKQRTKSQDSFFNRHFGAIITFVASVAALAVTFTQIYIAHIESDRIWRMKAADFIASNKESILSNKPRERELIRSMISIAYPKEISDVLVVKLADKDTSVLIARFWKPDGLKVNEANVTKLNKWLKANNIEVPLDSFILDERFENARARAVRDLNIGPRQINKSGMMFYY